MLAFGPTMSCADDLRSDQVVSLAHSGVTVWSACSRSCKWFVRASIDSYRNHPSLCVSGEDRSLTSLHSFRAGRYSLFSML